MSKNDNQYQRKARYNPNRETYVDENGNYVYRVWDESIKDYRHEIITVGDGGFTPEQLPPVTVVGSECAVPDGETVAPGQMVGNDVYPKIDKNEKEGSAL